MKDLFASMKDYKNKRMDILIYPTYNKNTCHDIIKFSIMFSWLNNIELQYAFRDNLWKNEDWKNRFIDWNEVMLKYIEEKVIKNLD